MGSYVAQTFALNYPDKVNKLIIYASDCSGKDAIARNPLVIQALRDTTGTTLEQGIRLLRLLFPSQWLEQHRDVSSYFPIPTETFSPISIENQTRAVDKWDGVCNTISHITQNTLIVTGTDDVIVPPANSLILVEKIPGAWLVQIKGGGHGLMYQYPEQFSKIVETFLEHS